MRFSVSTNKDKVICKLDGDLRFEHHKEFRKALIQIADTDHKCCVLDLAKVNYVDSAGLGMICLLLDQQETAGRSLTLSNAHDQVRTLIQITKLSSLLHLDG